MSISNHQLEYFDLEFQILTLSVNMPEIVEIRIMAETLLKYLPTRYIISVNSSGKYHLDQLPVPIRITGVSVKGKKLIISCDQDYHIVTSFGLTGRWVFKADKHIRATLNLGQVNKEGTIEPIGALYYVDQSNFGSIEVYKGVQSVLDSFKNKVGPDLLSENVTYETWLAQVQKPTTKKRKICDFLLEQKYFSGVGNVYRAEILYQAKLNPTRTLASLSQSELMALYTATISILREAYSAHGYGGHGIWDPSGQPGTYQTKVYDRVTDDLGNPVETVICTGNRKVYWVPKVQL